MFNEHVVFLPRIRKENSCRLLLITGRGRSNQTEMFFEGSKEEPSDNSVNYPGEKFPASL